jgi:hypothetical protein
MTRARAIELLKGIQLCCDLDECTNSWDCDECDEAFRMAIEALAEPKWIPCSERLPTLNGDGVSDMVLLCWSDGQRTVGAYRGDRTFVGQAWPVAKDVRVTVAAWQPLPEPYEEAGE